jgi:hypothetical protein
VRTNRFLFSYSLEPLLAPCFSCWFICRSQGAKSMVGNDDDRGFGGACLDVLVTEPVRINRSSRVEVK